MFKKHKRLFKRFIVSTFALLMMVTAIPSKSFATPVKNSYAHILNQQDSDFISKEDLDFLDNYLRTIAKYKKSYNIFLIDDDTDMYSQEVSDIAKRAFGDDANVVYVFDLYNRKGRKLRPDGVDEYSQNIREVSEYKSADKYFARDDFTTAFTAMLYEATYITPFHNELIVNGVYDTTGTLTESDIESIASAAEKLREETGKNMYFILYDSRNDYLKAHSPESVYSNNTYVFMNLDTRSATFAGNSKLVDYFDNGADHFKKNQFATGIIAVMESVYTPVDVPVSETVEEVTGLTDGEMVETTSESNHVMLYIFLVIAALLLGYLAFLIVRVLNKRKDAENLSKSVDNTSEEVVKERTLFPGTVYEDFIETIDTYIDSINEKAKDIKHNTSLKVNVDKTLQVIKDTRDNISENEFKLSTFQSFISYYLPNYIKMIDDYKNFSGINNSSKTRATLKILEDNLYKASDSFVGILDNSLSDTLTDAKLDSQVFVQKSLSDGIIYNDAIVVDKKPVNVELLIEKVNSAIKLTPAKKNVELFTNLLEEISKLSFRDKNRIGYTTIGRLEMLKSKSESAKN